MRNAIILHGSPSREEYYDPDVPSESNAHWLPWLQAQLLKHDIATATPEVPNAYDRNWPAWSREVERFDITPQTILVGHSTGAGFFIKYLSIHPEIMVDKVVLVAPWLDPEYKHTKNFFDDFEVDPGLTARTAGVTVFYADNDAKDIHLTIDILKAAVPGITYREFQGYGHFCYTDLKSDEFPELLEQVLQG